MIRNNLRKWQAYFKPNFWFVANCAEMSLNYNNVAIILAKIRIEFKFKDELEFGLMPIPIMSLSLSSLIDI